MTAPHIETLARRCRRWLTVRAIEGGIPEIHGGSLAGATQWSLMLKAPEITARATGSASFEGAALAAVAAGEGVVFSQPEPDRFLLSSGVGRCLPSELDSWPFASRYGQLDENMPPEALRLLPGVPRGAAVLWQGDRWTIAYSPHWSRSQQFMGSVYWLWEIPFRPKSEPGSALIFPAELRPLMEDFGLVECGYRDGKFHAWNEEAWLTARVPDCDLPSPNIQQMMGAIQGTLDAKELREALSKLSVLHRESEFKVALAPEDDSLRLTTDSPIGHLEYHVAAEWATKPDEARFNGNVLRDALGAMGKVEIGITGWIMTIMESLEGRSLTGVVSGMKGGQNG